MAETLFKKNILILTGADCSSPAVEIATVASKYKIPVISNGANASSLSSKDNYPWFIRVVTPSEEYDRYLVDLADNLGVKEVAYFYTTDAWGLGARKVIKETTEIKNISIKREFGFKRDTSQGVIDKFVYEVAKEGIKNIIITGPTPDTVRVFKAINKFGLNKKGNSIFATEMISADESIDAVNGSKGYFAPMTLLENSEILESFKLKLEDKIKKEVDVNSKAFFYGALSYDHIYTVAHAINNINKNDIPMTSQSLMSFLRKVDFIGATGRVYFSQNTNDRINMPLQIMNSHGYDAKSNTVKFKSIAKVSSDGQLVINKSEIIMPGYD
jgi:ABC-type branched-subunit amino acid transport system substrate-binding protein